MVTALVCGTVAVGVTAFVLWWPGIPNAQDAEIAQAISRHIREGHGRFLDTEDARESAGKAIYWRPGVGGDTTIDLYEVTTSEDIADIERLAGEALRATPGANRVTLRFYERQNWRVHPNGLHERLPEKLLQSVTYDKDD